MTSMKSVAELRNRALKWVFLVAFAIVVAVIVTGCATTVTPQEVERTQPSYDPIDTKKPTSGILLSVPSGFVVTGHFRARYNALIATYGRDFPVPLSPDHLIEFVGDDRWLISKKGMADFLLMCDWKAAGLKPKN